APVRPSPYRPASRILWRPRSQPLPRPIPWIAEHRPFSRYPVVASVLALRFFHRRRVALLPCPYPPLATVSLYSSDWIKALLIPSIINGAAMASITNPSVSVAGNPTANRFIDGA